MAVSLSNDITIGCSPDELFNYVTQPWKWHEWHPNSRSAESEHDALAAGDNFDEVIEIQPLSPLPLKMRRQTHYQVLTSVPGREWQVRGQMRDGWLTIHYRLQATATGTQFQRELHFDVHGLSRLLLPLLKPRMAKMSALALKNLKQRMEQGARYQDSLSTQS